MRRSRTPTVHGRTVSLPVIDLGRNRFVQTGFRFYPETGFGLVVQIKWTV